MYLLRRLALAAVVVLGAITIVFALSTVIVADPARAALGQEATGDQIAQYRRETGLDQPIWVQYAVYVSRVMRGDFGRSIVTKNSVTDDLGRALPATLELVIPSIILSTSLGIFAGVASAARRGGFVDHVSRLTSIAGMSLPVFWLGIVLQIIFYTNLSWLPASGRLSVTMTPPPTITGFYTIDALFALDSHLFLTAMAHLVLPVITLSLLNIATMARMTRASLLEVLRQDYVRTARAKGLAETAVVYRHALRNAMIPVLTVLGFRVGTLLGGAVIVETIFAWPGVGRYAVVALQLADIPVVAAFTIYVTVAYSLINLAIDLSYGRIDPRVRGA